MPVACRGLVSLLLLVVVVAPALAQGRVAPTSNQGVPSATPFGASLAIPISVVQRSSLAVSGDVHLVSTPGGVFQGGAPLTVTANFPYVVTVHWLANYGWVNTHSTLSLLTINSPASAGSQTGQVWVHLDSPGSGELPAGPDSSGPGYVNLQALFPDGGAAGTVQITLSAQ
jgi:hypothetical protein